MRAAARTVTTRDVAEMEALALAGHSREEIGRRTGWFNKTVKHHVGHLVPAIPNGQGRPSPDVERHRRMLRAVEAASYGERDAIAKRFGLKNALVLRVVLVRARRLVAEADPQIRAGE